MFVLVWSQVQHGSGSINHMMIAIRSIGSPLISAIPVLSRRIVYSIYYNSTLLLPVRGEVKAVEAVAWC